MSKVYVPDITYECYTFKDNNTIRAYESSPIVGTDINYIDYYTDNHYNSQIGVETILEPPICIASITDNIYYRNDIVDILILFLIFAFFGLFIPFKVFMRLFKRGRL